MARSLSKITHNSVLFYSFLLCATSVIFPVSAIEVFTPGEVFLGNGTVGTLSCTFKSTQVVSSQASVTWSFIPEGAVGTTAAETIFYYLGGRSFPTGTQFKDRVEWAGDLNKKDGSIRISMMQFPDNGTYYCDVKNPPDVDGKPSLIKLRVVAKDTLPQTSSAVIAGIVVGVIIGLAIIIVIAYLLIRLMRSPPDYEGCTSVETLSAQATRPGKKTESSTEGSRCSSPSAPVQGPVIYAQLDHSGSKNPNAFHKMEPVVYADIRKN